MNVELVLVLFVALLYGPTVLWLVLRTLRGHRRRLPESWRLRTPARLAGRIRRRRGARRSGRVLGLRRLPFAEPARVEPLLQLSDGEGLRQSPGCRPADGERLGPGDGRRHRRTHRRGGWDHGDPSGTLECPGDCPRSLAELSSSRRCCSRTRASAARRLPVSRVANDPSTRYDFPDPGNSCRPTGTTRSQPIDLGHQQSRCLTAAHVQCARYRAVEVVVAGEPVARSHPRRKRTPAGKRPGPVV